MAQTNMQCKAGIESSVFISIFTVWGKFCPLSTPVGHYYRHTKFKDFANRYKENDTQCFRLQLANYGHSLQLLFCHFDHCYSFIFIKFCCFYFELPFERTIELINFTNIFNSFLIHGKLNLLNAMSKLGLCNDYFF